MVAFSAGVFLRRSKQPVPPTFSLCRDAPLPSPLRAGGVCLQATNFNSGNRGRLGQSRGSDHQVGCQGEKRDRREGEVLSSLPASSPPPFLSHLYASLSFLKFSVVITRENKVPECHEDTWPALQATLILWSLLKTRLDLLGGRVWYTSSLPQYFDHRLNFSVLNIITILEKVMAKVMEFEELKKRTNPANLSFS